MNSGKVESTKDNLNLETTMAEDSMASLESSGQQGGEDFLRSLAGRVLAQVMECEVSNRLGAGKHERSEGRAGDRNGYRERPLHTRLGTQRWN